MQTITHNPNLPRLLTEPEAAEILGLKPTTLRNNRSLGVAVLQHVRVGGSIRYRQSDIENFIISNVVAATAAKS